MKKLLLPALCLGFALPFPLMAEDETTATMKIEGENGTLGAIQISTASEITFSENTLMVTGDSETKAYALTEIAEITFSLSTSSADKLSAELSDGLHVDLCNCMLSVSTDNGQPISVNIFSASAQFVASHKGSGYISVDLSSLPGGMYIIRINNKAIKFVR